MNWYCSREAVKRAAGIGGSDRDSVIDSHIEAASREIDSLTNRRFIPISATRKYPWPQRDARRGYVLYLDEDLLSVDTNGLTKEGSDATVIAATDFFEEPKNRPPYSRIEIDLASTAFFASKNTHQQQVRVTGSWGYSKDTVAAGTLISGTAASTSATSLVWSDASLVDVGDTILIGTEQMFVSKKETLDTACDTNGALTATKSQTTVTVDDGTKVKAGEIILINSERFYVKSVTGNDLETIRGYDGSALAAHDDDQGVYAFRTLTVVRAVNGTTGAFHANTTAATKYAPPADLVGRCKALAIAYYNAEKGGWTGGVGSGDERVSIRSTVADKIRDGIKRHYGRRVIGAV